MEECHRKIIKSNLDNLISKTDYDELKQLCINYKIMSPVMVENLKRFPENERHKELFIKITKRGPTAFNTLREIFKTKFPTAEKILCPNENDFTSIHEKKRLPSYREQETSSISTRDDVNDKNILNNINLINKNDGSPLKLEIYSRPTHHNNSIVVQKSTEIHFDKTAGTYSMQSKYRGVFLMVNIIRFSNSTSTERNGAQIDRENLIYLFREFGFEVFYYEDLEQKQFEKILEELLKSEYVRRTECFAMAVMTHGNMDKGLERIEFYDGAHMDLNHVLEYFSNSLCPYLLGKPKFFIFPFCRGDVADKGMYGGETVLRRAETDGSGSNSISRPTMSDVLILYATVPGFKTHRDPDKGSWYVQIMCELWSKHAHDTDIETLEKMVGEKTGLIREYGGGLQTSSKVAYGFHKTLYFNPGYYAK